MCCNASVQALGLEGLRVQSGLGQPLRASLTMVGAEAVDIAPVCVRAHVESTEGVLLAPASVALLQNSSGRVVQITTRQNLQEPAAKIVVDVACDAQLHREYMILLDPPQFFSASSSAELPLVNRAVINTAGQPATTAYPASSQTDKPARTRKTRKSADSDKNGSPTSPLLKSDALPDSADKAKNPKSTKPVKEGKTTKATKDVLKLSDDTVFVPRGLRLSDSLSEQNSGQAQNIDELRSAQAEMAAILRGDNPEKIAETQLKVGQQRMQSLQSEAAQLKRQSQIDKAALDDWKENSYSRNWIVALLGLLLIGVVAIVGLLVHITRLNKRSQFAWSELEPEATEEPKRNVEDIVNSVQDSYNAESSIIANSVLKYQQTHPVTEPVRTVEKVAHNTGDVPRSEVASRGGPATRPAPVKSGLPSLEESNSSTFNFFASRGSSVAVEEISDVTQEAEFWMSVNDPQRAIEILEPLAAVESPESPVPWLYLLDLYRVTKNKEKYDGMRERFTLIFNANIPDFETEQTEIGARTLEDFEHLMKRICDMWTSNEILPFLQSLLIDDREGKRMGFDLPVYRDILLLIAIANELERTRTSDRRVGGPRDAIAPALAPVDVNAENDELGALDFEVIDFQKNLPSAKT